MLAFARRYEGQAAIVAAPRLSYTLMRGKEEPPVGSAWGDAELALPPEAIDYILFESLNRKKRNQTHQ